MAVLPARGKLEDYIVSLGIPGVSRSTFTDFEFHVGQTPLSDLAFPLTTVVIYCIGIPLLQRFMKNRKSPPLKLILIIHNIFLSLISGFLLIFLLSTLWSFIDNENYSYFRVYCQLTHYEQQGTLTFIFYINYLLKYYELLDTIFLALKHKPISFLHAYHHPATLVLTWGQLLDSTGVQWVVISLNLFVHTIMYFYYACAALKIKIPWKMSVTILQILQFILDLAACYYAWFDVYTHRNCYGHWRAGFMGCFILTSYLYLFIDFFFEKYYNKDAKKKKDTQKKKKKKNQ